MIVRAGARTFVGLLLLGSQNLYAGDAVPLAGTYSSLTFNAEGGDLVGYEVRIIPTNAGNKALVQVAEGDAGRVYLVDVVILTGSIEFDVPLTSSKAGKFTGQLSVAGLRGSISYPTGVRESVFLHRGASYWEQGQKNKCR